jgi:hypothetical protein
LRLGPNLKNVYYNARRRERTIDPLDKLVLDNEERDKVAIVPVDYFAPPKNVRPEVAEKAPWRPLLRVRKCRICSKNRTCRECREREMCKTNTTLLLENERSIGV